MKLLIRHYAIFFSLPFA